MQRILAYGPRLQARSFSFLGRLLRPWEEAHKVWSACATSLPFSSLSLSGGFAPATPYLSAPQPHISRLPSAASSALPATVTERRCCLHMIFHENSRSVHSASQSSRCGVAAACKAPECPLSRLGVCPVPCTSGTLANVQLARQDTCRAAACLAYCRSYRLHLPSPIQVGNFKPRN